MIKTELLIDDLTDYCDTKLLALDIERNIKLKRFRITRGIISSSNLMLLSNVTKSRKFAGYLLSTKFLVSF